MQVSKTIEAPIEKVWEVLTDTRQWPLWGPSVSAVDSMQQYISAGLHGRIKTVLGFWASFKVTRYEPLIYWSWQVAGISATGHRLRHIGPTKCELIFEIPLLAFPYALICRRAIDNIDRLACQD